MKAIEYAIEIMFRLIQGGLILLGFTKIKKKGSTYDKVLAYLFVIVCIGFAIGG